MGSASEFRLALASVCQTERVWALDCRSVWALAIRMASETESVCQTVQG